MRQRSDGPRALACMRIRSRLAHAAAHLSIDLPRPDQDPCGSLPHRRRGEAMPHFVIAMASVRQCLNAERHASWSRPERPTIAKSRQLRHADSRQEAHRHRHAQAARCRRDAHARAVRRAPQRRRQADDADASSPRPSRPPTCWCRPSPTASTAAVISQAGPQLEADRQFRHRRRQHRPRHGAQPRHHRHQHAGRADRRHRRHDHGADPGRAAPAGRRHGLLKDPTSTWTGWSPTWMLGHRIYGKRLGIIGMGRIGQAVARARQGVRPADPLPQPPPRRARRSSRSWRRPTGTASTRCWRAWTSSPSTARTRRRPITCCRRGG